MKTQKLNLVKKALLICMISAFVMSTFNLQAGDDNKIVIGEKVTIKSNALDEERQMLIYLPAGYDRTATKYHVLYLLDGGYHFFHVSGIVQFLSSQGLIPQMIVVAIRNVDRNRDFSPSHVEAIPTSGGAEKFMFFLSDELIPYIDDNFRTQSYRILVGHSFGGTFATYALLEKPDLFDAYIAISPYLQFDNELLVKQAETDLKSSYNKDICFYMTLGNEPDYIPALEKFTSIIKSKSPAELELVYINMKEETHGSIPHLSIYNGLEEIYSDWKLPDEIYNEGLAAIDKHYKYLSDKYGNKIQTPEYIINLLGYTCLNKKEFDKAIKIFKENVKRFPKSANVYDSLGEAYEKNGQSDQAKKNYAKACKLAEKEAHVNLIIYKDNLSRIQKTLVK